MAVCAGAVDIRGRGRDRNELTPAGPIDTTNITGLEADAPSRHHASDTDGGTRAEGTDGRGYSPDVPAAHDSLLEALMAEPMVRLAGWHAGSQRDQVGFGIESSQVSWVGRYDTVPSGTGAQDNRCVYDVGGAPHPAELTGFARALVIEDGDVDAGRAE